MKIKVVEVTSNSGRFLIEDGEEPEVGKRYQLADLTDGTLNQNAAFHALVTEYWRSGLWSYDGSGYRPGMTFHEFRDVIKKNLGAGFEAYYVASVEDGQPKATVYKKWKDVPASVRSDPQKAEYCYGRLKSWGDYTRKERIKTIDNLIAEMDQVGVTTKKYFEILKGMQDNATQGGRNER